jgi:hypothetical protein
MGKNENGKLVRKTVYVPPEVDKLFQRLADEGDESYNDVANRMFERGIVIEGALENGYPIVIETPDEDIRLNDDRPKRLIDKKWADKLKP